MFRIVKLSEIVLNLFVCRTHSAKIVNTQTLFKISKLFKYENTFLWKNEALKSGEIGNEPG